MPQALYHILDWFIPLKARRDRSDQGMSRTFVFTHLFGPLLAMPMGVLLFLADDSTSLAKWIVIGCIASFWLLPLVLRSTGNMVAVSLMSVELLAFAALFGAYHYGGVSSPFMPWLVISVLLAFFYLNERPRLVIGLYVFNITTFLAFYLTRDNLAGGISLEDLELMGWLSLAAATIYVTWMAIYYANVIALRSDLQAEVARHRETSKRLEEVKERAEQANRVRSIFLAKMSHELRTPLNAVIGYSEILLEDGEDRPGYEAKAPDLKRINAAGKHLLSLVADVLDFAKIESNAVSLKPTRFTLGNFVDEVVASAKPMIDRNANHLVVQCPQTEDIVNTDPIKLRQVTINLLSNAGKFTHNGTVILDVRCEARPAGDWIRIEVADTGIGIEPESLPKLFNDFGQANPSIADTYGGTGLGLALSQRFCGLLGGSISVESKPGRGSRFVAHVPSSLADAPEGDDLDAIASRDTARAASRRDELEMLPQQLATM